MIIIEQSWPKYLDRDHSLVSCMIIISSKVQVTYKSNIEIGEENLCLDLVQLFNKLDLTVNLLSRSVVKNVAKTVGT